MGEARNTKTFFGCVLVRKAKKGERFSSAGSTGLNSKVSQISKSVSCKSASLRLFFGGDRCSALLFAICKLVADLRSNSFFWRGQVLCSTFCHLRVSHRFEVKLAARRFGTNFHVGSPLGGIYPLSSTIFVFLLCPAKNQLTQTRRKFSPTPHTPGTQIP